MHTYIIHTYICTLNVHTYIHTGGFLCDYSIQVCFIVAAAVSVVSIISCWLLLEESLLYHHSHSSRPTDSVPSPPIVMKKFDLSKTNPLPGNMHAYEHKILQCLICGKLINT